MKNVTPTISVMKVNACKNSSNYFSSTGGYITGGYNFLAASEVSVTYSKQTDHDIFVLVQYNHSVSETSETHVVVELNSLTVNFSVV